MTSYDNSEDLDDVSQMRRNFKEAFEGDTTQNSLQPGERIALLEAQIKELRAKYRKEEATRR